MDLEFRSARADDRGPIAELIYSAGPHVYDYLHGKRALAFIRKEFDSGRGFAGYPHVSVALLNGEVVATGSFYDREVFKDRTNETIKNMTSFHGLLAGLPLLLRGKHVGNVVRRPRPGEFYLSNFGVVPGLRSKGIGSALVAHHLERARHEGFTHFGLHVSSDNPRGQALYERLGLVVTKNVEFTDKRANIPVARKMELVL